jgi:site-specific recombinase XerD
MLEGVSLFKSGRTGRYYAQYYDEGGKRRQFSCRASTRRLAEKYAVQKLKEFSGSHFTKTKSHSLSSYRSSLIKVVTAHLSPETVKAYNDSFNQLIKRYGDIQLCDLDVNKCQDFLFCRQPSVQTAAKHYRHLSRAFKLAVRQGFMRQNPFELIDKPRPVEQKKDFLKEREFEDFITRLPTNTFSQRRFRRMVIVGKLTGMRLNEICNLRRAAVDFELSVIRISAYEDFRTKSGRSRVIPLSKVAAKVLNTQLDEIDNSESISIRSSMYVFPNLQGNKLTIYTVSKAFKKFAQAAFPEMKRLCFHSLRSTFITLAFHAKVPPAQIQIAAGHKSIHTTEGYAHLENLPMVELKAALNEMPDYSC